jgi:hypothetical protein
MKMSGVLRVVGSLKCLLLFQMAVIFNEKGVQDCHPPCVAQSFINHNAVLYKIYVVGDEYIVTERPSLKNFYPSGMSSIYQRIMCCCGIEWLLSLLKSFLCATLSVCSTKHIF